mgnify:CR=1 FL=1
MKEIALFLYECSQQICSHTYPNAKEERILQNLFHLFSSLFLCFMINCVTCPVKAITSTVDMSEITIMAVRNSCMTLHDSSSPTVAGINIIGIIYIRNLPVSFTADSFITPQHSAVNSMTMPYMLAGIGNGIILFNNSPTSDIAMIISN